MSQESFDYGGSDDGSSTSETRPFNELDDLLGISGAEHHRPSKPGSRLAELNMRVLLQVIVAVVLLAVAGGLLARDVWARQTRDSAFNQVMDATDKREYQRVIEGAEKFLMHQPLNGSMDAREVTVVNLYSEALVHWVAQQPGNKLDANALGHIARYKQLVKNIDK